MSQAWLGQGSLLSLGDGNNPENFLVIVEIKSINGPDEKAAVVDVTSHSSPSRRREYVAGLIDPGSLKFDAVWLPDDPSQDAVTGFYSVFNSGAKRDYQLRLSNPQHNVLSFQGIAVTHSKVIPIDKEGTFTGEIKITSVITVL